MATLSSKALTLVDFAKLLDPATNSVTTTIAELLSQTNEVLDDMLWKEGNLPTGHQIVIRTGLPDVVWRKLNAGVPSSKSTTAQVTETCGMLEAICEVDKDLADLNGNTAAFRMSQSSAFIEAMNQEMADTLFYGDHTANPEEFLGLAPRYTTISGATNGQNILSGSGSGSDNTSVWLLGWGENTVHGIFPKGSKAGLQHTKGTGSAGDGADWAFDSSGNRFKAYIDHYQWKCGIAIPDWRYAVRIANIDVSNLVGESSAADLLKLMFRAIYRLPTRKNIRAAFYCNRTVQSMIGIQGLNKSSNAVTVQEALGQFGEPLQTVKFFGIPVRIVDAIRNTEATIS